MAIDPLTLGSQPKYDKSKPILGDLHGDHNLRRVTNCTWRLAEPR